MIFRYIRSTYCGLIGHLKRFVCRRRCADRYPGNPLCLQLFAMFIASISYLKFHLRNKETCHFAAYKLSDWVEGICSETCGDAVRTDVRYCISENGTRVDPEKCTGLSTRMANCSLPDCPGDKLDTLWETAT